MVPDHEIGSQTIALLFVGLLAWAGLRGLRATYREEGLGSAVVAVLAAAVWLVFAYVMPPT